MRRRSLLIVIAILSVIGIADYASGIRVSLSVFYIVPVLLSVAWFGARTGALCVLLSVFIRVAGDLIANRGQMLPWWSWWNSATTLLVFLFIVSIFSNLLAVYRRMEERVAIRTTELLFAADQRRLLEHELVTISSNERNRMGQELHDDICQHLVATTLAAKVLAQRLEHQHNPLSTEAQAIIGLIEEGTGKTRQLARGLLLSAIEPGRLSEQLATLAEEGSRSGVPCTFHGAGSVTVADSGTATELYRIAQEAMRNAVRHAGATHVGISLVGDAQAICLTVEDDGRGLPEVRTNTGLGLPIMAHRAAYIGATLSLIPSAGRGTRMLCHLPLAPV